MASSQCCGVTFAKTHYWLNVCSKCPPLTLMHAWRHVRHCLIAASIMRWSICPKLHVHAVRQCPWSASCRPSPALRTLYSRPDLNSGCLVAKAYRRNELWGLHCQQLNCPTSHRPMGWCTVLLKHVKVTVDEFLAVFASVNLPDSTDWQNFYARLNEMYVGCSNRHTNGHH